MAINPISWIKDKFRDVNTEPEYEEPVEHDTVMVMVNGKMVEVTKDDLEEGQ